MLHYTFRGKSTQSGAWLYGTPIYNGDNVHIITPIGVRGTITLSDATTINAATLSLQSDLTDVTGRPIYEADLVTIGTDHQHFYCVLFDDGTFYIDFGGTSTPLSHVHTNCTVINNIFDF